MANKVITKFDVDGTGSNNFTIRPTHAYMGTCTTEGSTAAKTVTITPAVDNFLEAGVRITVYFSNANNATNPTLSINSGTAKKIYKGSSAITAKLLSIGYHDFIYDGTQWQYVSSYIDTNTTYGNLSASNTNTSNHYTVPGAGSNTGYFLRGDGSWRTPTNTTYTTFTTSAAGLTPASGANTAKFLRGDGSWQTPPNDNTTYARISASNTTTNASYTVPGAGSNTGYFLRGDGSWQVPVNTEYHVLDSEHFDAQEPLVVYGPGHFDHHLFLNGEGSWSIPPDTTYARISASNTTTYESYTVPGAGTNTGKFLRGDGSWETPANTTYDLFNISRHGLVPRPQSGQNNTNYILSGDGTWIWYNNIDDNMAKNEYLAMVSSISPVLGTVLPIDYYGRTNFIPYFYEAEPDGIQVLVPSTPTKLQYAIAVGMDDAGHLFIPITDEFKNMLIKEMGYTDNPKK